MPLSEETKKFLREKGREDLIEDMSEIMEINDSGYAGILPNGNIVDRRKHPEAIPVQENKMLGIPKSKPINREEAYCYCHSCGGTGEGPADGTRCSTCKGEGEILTP